MSGFFCNECGAETGKWTGKCPSCGAWNSLKESSRVTGKNKSKGHAKAFILEGTRKDPIKIAEVKSGELVRKKSGIGEFDGVLGGGIVPGMVVLIGGEPGIGKSTLMLQAADKLAVEGNKVLYVSGEESEEQIKIRSDRMGCGNANLYLFCATETEMIWRAIEKMEPDMVIVDSIQSVYSLNQDSAPGSITQLRECTAFFTRLAKQHNIPCFLIGHVTKDGAVAGPKIIEHMVDTVLYFEGDSRNQYKLLRANKNRFGSTNEIGLFEMKNSGLAEIENPSQLFLSQDGADVGCAVGSVLEGSRAFLVEVQALTSSSSYGNSQRVALGFDQRKLAMLLAVIEKNLSMNLRNSDVFLNLAGGIKVIEPGIDLAVIAALLSSFRNTILPPQTVLFGEVGLNGEVRPVSQIAKRIKEARKLGYKNIIVPAANSKAEEQKGVIYIRHIRQINKMLFG